MASTIKMRASAEGEIVTVKALVSHPMETGLRKDSATGEKIPAHYITKINAESADRLVFSARWGIAISKNPYLSFKYRNGKKGDLLKITWVDNLGMTDSFESEVK